MEVLAKSELDRAAQHYLAEPLSTLRASRRGKGGNWKEELEERQPGAIR